MDGIGEREGVQRRVPVAELVARVEACDAKRRRVGHRTRDLLPGGALAERPEQGVRLLRKFAEDVVEFGTVESNPTIDGRNMVMVIAPHKNKSEVKTEQNAQRAAHREAARQARTGAPAETAAE